MKLARLAPLAAALALVGCAPSASTAAEVDGHRITQHQVDELLEGCPTFMDQPLTDKIAVSVLVQSEMVRQVGEQNGVEVTMDETRQAVAASPQYAALLQDSPGCVQLFYPEVGLNKIGTAVGQDSFRAINDMDVKVNPRYGNWDTKTGTVSGSGSISTPFAAGN